jgi:hypothetical protein
MEDYPPLWRINITRDELSSKLFAISDDPLGLTFFIGPKSSIVYSMTTKVFWYHLPSLALHRSKWTPASNTPVYPLRKRKQHTGPESLTTSPKNLKLNPCSLLPSRLARRKRSRARSSRLKSVLRQPSGNQARPLTPPITHLWPQRNANSFPRTMTDLRPTLMSMRTNFNSAGPAIAQSKQTPSILHAKINHPSRMSK